MNVTELEKRMGLLYRDYKQLVTPSEVPNEFHLFVFLTMISALVGDKIFFNEGNDTVYPNIWTMLVGQSGTSRKSTAFRPSLKILGKIDEVNLLAPSASPEGFYKELEEYEGVGLLRHTELGTLLGSLRKDYMGGFVDFLCEMYDPMSAPLRRRLSKDTTNIDKLAVSWIAATTPDSLNKCGASSRIASGFLPRWNIVFGTPSPTFISYRKRLTGDYFVNFIQKLRQMIPTTAYEIRLGEEALATHEVWYIKHRTRMTKYPNETLDCFGIRILEVVKKYAVLLAYLHNQTTVTKGAMETAIMFGDYFFSTADRLVTTEIAENLFEADCQKILRAIIRYKGKATVRQLMRSTHFKKKDLEERVDTMTARGDVIFKAEGNDCFVRVASENATKSLFGGQK